MVKRLLIILGAVILLLALILGIPPIRRFVLYKTPLNRIMPVKGKIAADTVAAEIKPASAAFTEPDINRIKADLIGKSVPGWNFDKAEEFREASITSIARTEQRIDFRLNLSLQAVSGADRSVYEVQMFATYLAGEEDWYLDKLLEIYIAFDAEIPPGKNFKVYSVPGCTMHPEPNVKLEWTSKGWDYKIITGPEYEEVNLPPADVYEVRSKAKRMVKVRLTFKPVE